MKFIFSQRGFVRLCQSPSLPYPPHLPPPLPHPPTRIPLAPFLRQYDVQTQFPKLFSFLYHTNELMNNLASTPASPPMPPTPPPQSQPLSNKLLQIVGKKKKGKKGRLCKSLRLILPSFSIYIFQPLECEGFKQESQIVDNFIISLPLPPHRQKIKMFYLHSSGELGLPPPFF